MKAEEYIPSELLVRRASKLTILPTKSKIKTVLGKDITISRSLDKSGIKEIQRILSEFLYAAVETICYRNLACEYINEQQRKKFAQVPDNIKLSIVSDSRERFNSGIEKILLKFLPIKESKNFLKDLNKEFFDYISRTGGYNTKLGNFYLDSGKIYFKTEKSLPPKTEPGDSIVVGGIDI